MRRKDILDKIFEKVVDHLGCYCEESNVAPIDRDRFMKALCNEIGFNYTWKPVWIPVTERLPETSDPVLVTYIFHGDRLFTGAKIIREVATANYYNEARFPHDCEFYYELVDVIAWMPLPEPYKVGEQV